MDWNRHNQQPQPQVNLDQFFQDLFNQPKKIITWIGIALLIWAALSSFFLVDTQQRAVITRFGKYIRTEPPGPHLKLPFGIEEKILVSTEQVQQETFGTTDPAEYTNFRFTQNVTDESSMLTGDLNVVEVKWVVQYFINDPQAYLFNVANPRKNIRDISQAVMRRVVGDRMVSGVMHNFSEVQLEATELTQAIFDAYEMGVDLEEIKVLSVEPPEIVRPAFNEVNAAKQEQERDINVAEREKNSKIPAAKGEAERKVSEATGNAKYILNQAKGDAERLKNVLAAYDKAPEVTRVRLYLELVEQLMQNVKSITVVDPEIKGLLPVFDSIKGSNSGSESSTRAQANIEKLSKEIQ